MSEKKKKKVTIYGNEYTIVSIESEEYLEKVAKFIDNKMQNIASCAVA